MDGNTCGEDGDKREGELLHLEEELHKRVVGQDEAISAIADAVRPHVPDLTTPTALSVLSYPRNHRCGQDGIGKGFG